jgi:hypothetical protein
MYYLIQLFPPNGNLMLWNIRVFGSIGVVTIFMRKKQIRVHYMLWSSGIWLSPENHENIASHTQFISLYNWSDGWAINEQWIRKDVKGNADGLIWASTLAFALRSW